MEDISPKLVHADDRTDLYWIERCASNLDGRLLEKDSVARHHRVDSADGHSVVHTGATGEEE